jgi:hypothetical protein
MGPKNAQNTDNGFGFEFFERGDEIWVSLLNVETKEQSKPKKFKQMSARKLMATALGERKGVLVVKFV